MENKVKNHIISSSTFQIITFVVLLYLFLFVPRNSTEISRIFNIIRLAMMVSLTALLINIFTLVGDLSKKKADKS